MTELKPCPCCEGKAKYFIDTMVYGPPDHIVYCTNCGLKVTGYNSKKEAMEAWNRRPNPLHTGTPTEEGDYICAFRMSDGSVEYGWCCWDGTGWDIMCDYDPEDTPIVGWQKIEPYIEVSK